MRHGVRTLRDSGVVDLDHGDTSAASRGDESAMSYRILLVDPNSTWQATAAAALARADYRVATVSTFEQARQQIALDCPDVLITAIRLGAFNGLQLVLRVRVECGDLPVVVTGAPADFIHDIDRAAGHSVPPPMGAPAPAARAEELLAARTRPAPAAKRP